MAMRSIDPATGNLIAELEENTPQDVEAALARAEDAFKAWRKLPLHTRCEYMQATARQLRADKARLAGLITAEMGKPITEAEAEVEKCAWCCDHFAAEAGKLLADRLMPSSATQSYVAFDPIGTVLAVMPWNFPFWQVFRFAAPGLVAGNTAILKHASNVPQCARAIEEVFTKAGLPEGVFQTLLIGSDQVARLIEDDRIKAVTLTGSDIAGSRVAEASGRALKKTVLELGGSDPFIILEDADLDAAVNTAVNARYQNTGQSCIAAKRFIVAGEAFEPFLSAFSDAVGRLQVGDPTQRETRIGPLARDDLRSDLDQQVKQSLEQGASLISGGHFLDRPGYFYAPTVVSGARPGMTVFDEETFGPVAAVVRADDEDHAIELANDSRFGLGAALWTSDIEKAQIISREIESGSVFINGMVASDPRLPFGGVKRSGYGRELSEFGIHEFVNIKTVWIGPAQTASPSPAASE